MKNCGNRLGIMVHETGNQPPFAEERFCRRLCLLGKRLGLQVVAFSPDRVDWRQKTVIGYSFCERRSMWIESFSPLPPVIYDRWFSSSPTAFRNYRSALRKLDEIKDVHLLGRGLRDKWSVYRMLLRDPILLPYLPETEIVASLKTVFARLCKNGEIFLKPQAGSQGKGVLGVRQSSDNEYEAKGRDWCNRPIEVRFNHPLALMSWIKRFTAGRPYLMQPYLELTSPDQEPFDIRALVQKNGKGRWGVTGIAVRHGQPGGVTANLHGGGKAEEAGSFLRILFGEDQAKELLDRLQKCSLHIPQILESQHGRLAELGIDWGIDRSGNLWLLEINSKPGRTAFFRLNDRNVRLAAVCNPLCYARYLLERF